MDGSSAPLQVNVAVGRPEQRSTAHVSLALMLAELFLFCFFYASAAVQTVPVSKWGRSVPSLPVQFLLRREVTICYSTGVLTTLDASGMQRTQFVRPYFRLINK